MKQQVAPAAVQGSNTPYQVSSDTYTLEARDPGIISALRSFGRLLTSTPLGSTAYLKRIKDIRAGGFFDIICKVTSWQDAVCAICLTLQHTDIVHAAFGTEFFLNSVECCMKTKLMCRCCLWTIETQMLLSCLFGMAQMLCLFPSRKHHPATLEVASDCSSFHSHNLPCQCAGGMTHLRCCDTQQFVYRPTTPCVAGWISWMQVQARLFLRELSQTLPGLQLAAVPCMFM